MILWLRTGLFFAGWVIATLMIGLIALPALISQRATWGVAYHWAGFTLFWLCVSCGTRSSARGLEHLPQGAGLIASKHQSAWDTLMLWRLLKNPAFVLKRELYWIPIFGWYLWRAGQIGIDRSSGRDAVSRMLRGAKKVIAEGRCIIIFPEGTRVPPGEQKPFRTGVARVSESLQLPVVPAALNSGLFWPKYSLKKLPGEAVMEFLPAEPPFREPLEPWLQHLQQIINTRSA